MDAGQPRKGRAIADLSEGSNARRWRDMWGGRDVGAIPDPAREHDRRPEVTPTGLLGVLDISPSVLTRAATSFTLFRGAES